MIKHDSEDEDQGELFPVDADDDAYDWDEVEDNGIAPPCGPRRQDPNGTGNGRTQLHAHSVTAMVSGVRGRQEAKRSP